MTCSTITSPASPTPPSSPAAAERLRRIERSTEWAGFTLVRSAFDFFARCAGQTAPPNLENPAGSSAPGPLRPRPAVPPDAAPSLHPRDEHRAFGGLPHRVRGGLARGRGCVPRRGVAARRNRRWQPGLRHYAPRYYAAFVRDPDGYR